MKIWCLFLVANNYDQPDHNLVTFWSYQPKFADIKKLFHEFTDVQCGKLSRGLHIKDHCATSYSIHEIDEAMFVSDSIEASNKRSMQKFIEDSYSDDEGR